jgi:hypothetical protein
MALFRNRSKTELARHVYSKERVYRIEQHRREALCCLAGDEA